MDKFSEILALRGKRIIRDVSLWSGDLLDQRSSIEKTEAVSDMYHIDVADAHFVHGLLFFPDLIAAINKKTEKMLHVHLMMDDPYGHLDDFIEAGADILTVHVELGEKKIKPIFAHLKEKGVLPGLAICVETPVSAIVPYLDDVKVIVLMGTKIGIKGVGLEPSTYDRLKELRKIVDKSGKNIIISSDGGIRTNTVPELYRSGADMITPGSLYFKSENLAETVAWLESLKR